ncbi:MAG: hypothetical protein KGI06_06250 [Candidatus Micrarchaeota archaeon]|nr:hypothetical protein [Candidatus Micrarchaeota archaeon]
MSEETGEKDNGHKFYIKALHPHRKPGDTKKVKMYIGECTKCGLLYKFRKKVKCPAK